MRPQTTVARRNSTRQARGSWSRPSLAAAQRLDEPYRDLIGGVVVETVETVERGLGKLADDRPGTGAERLGREHHVFEFASGRRLLQKRDEVAPNRCQRVGRCRGGVDARLTEGFKQCVQPARREGGIQVLIALQRPLAGLGKVARPQQVLADDVRRDRVDAGGLFDDAEVGKLVEPPPQLRTVAAEDLDRGGDIVGIAKIKGADAGDYCEQLAGLAGLHSGPVQPNIHMLCEQLGLGQLAWIVARRRQLASDQRDPDVALRDRNDPAAHALAFDPERRAAEDGVERAAAEQAEPESLWLRQRQATKRRLHHSGVTGADGEHQPRLGVAPLKRAQKLVEVGPPMRVVDEHRHVVAGLGL